MSYVYIKVHALFLPSTFENFCQLILIWIALIDFAHKKELITDKILKIPYPRL